MHVYTKPSFNLHLCGNAVCNFHTFQVHTITHNIHGVNVTILDKYTKDKSSLHKWSIDVLRVGWVGVCVCVCVGGGGGARAGL